MNISKRRRREWVLVYHRNHGGRLPPEAGKAVGVELLPQARGITQKSLAHGVPVVAVPFGRDQPEVAGDPTAAADALERLTATRK